MATSSTRGTGIDIGSTTVKVVVQAGGVVVHRAYARHQGRCLEAARRLLAGAPSSGGPTVVTGSAGVAFAEELGAAFIHEVPAVAAAVRHLHPATRTVVELGGQDTKLLTFVEGDCASDMNERCAAGTGAMLDRCLNRLGLAADELTRLALPDGLPVPLVSAKCGVFAEADVIGLVKAGRRLEEALAGLLDAVVRGTLNALARGRPLTPGVLLLGGPHAFIPGLATLWRRRLAERWAERGVAAGEVIVPEGAQFFAALGALLCDSALQQVAHARRSARRSLQAHGVSARPAEREATRPELAVESPAAVRVPAQGPLALGLDAGSTTVKGVLLDARGALAATAYRKATQDPFADARGVLLELAAQLRGDGRVAAFGVTGYAAELLGPALGADRVIVETLAHARAARHAVPDADVVCDVGGQDIKVLVLAAHGVHNFRLSHQCAAGNGALLEAAASDFGVPLEASGALALSATRRPTFSVGCAVFLDTERVTAQRDGFTPAEILAGLAQTLPRNVWENVAAVTDLRTLGSVFVLSGGVQRNPAVVRAQVEYLRERHPAARVVIHPCAGEAGAVGAALLSLEAAGPTRFIGFDALATTRWETRSGEALRCRSCLSACARVEVSALTPDGETRRILTGQGCERGELSPPAGDGATRDLTEERGGARNLVLLEATRMFGRVREVKPASTRGAGLRVGIPRVLPMYRAAPLFTHYFEALGVPREQLATGAATSEALWRGHGGHGTVDACYPAKVAQAHVAAMLGDRSRPLDVLFFPALTHALTAVVGCVDTASCPVVAGTPLVTAAAFGADEAGRLPGGVRLLRPTLALCSHPQLSASLFEAARSVLPGLTRPEHDAALVEGFKAQREFEATMEALGARLIDDALQARRAAVVMIGRPYHADPGLHHHLASELQALGRSTLSLRALPKKGLQASAAVDCEAVNDLREAAPSLTNSGDGEKLAAARFVARHPYLVAIEISHFKCGQDASMYGAIADLARTGGRPFLALHDLDETRPVASLRLRLRTFLDAVERWERAQAGGPS
ncbi:MAG: hypothetical protein JNJ54_03105 [Myxococcaceae bacterium]|nr:hypothetical protein [Myxococcaceae bacterium]